eukprot:18690-Heterococcus_DN1.PRE.1
MIVQAIGLLDELDKEINTYAMRVREWYGWHFPEMAKLASTMNSNFIAAVLAVATNALYYDAGSPSATATASATAQACEHTTEQHAALQSTILNDNMHFAKCVLRMGTRDKCKHVDFSDIIGDESIEHTLKENAEISMGTEITDMDLKSISALAEQPLQYCCRVLVLSASIARLSAAAQILGAEKALFRALKTKHDTPKYGLIYHASLIGQTAPKNKGKISRVLAAKTALAIRVDAMGETTDTTLGLESRAKSSKRQCSSVTALAIALASFSKRATCTTAHGLCRGASGAAGAPAAVYYLLIHANWVEARIRLLEGGARLSLSGAKTPSGVKKYDAK